MRLTQPMRRILTDLQSGRYILRVRGMSRGTYQMQAYGCREPDYCAAPGAVRALIDMDYLRRFNDFLVLTGREDV